MPAAPPANTPTISTPAEIKSAQEHLKYLGYDMPAATGSADPRTKIAFKEFQQSLGAEATGELTYDQLQALFVKAAGQMATAHQAGAAPGR